MSVRRPRRAPAGPVPPLPRRWGEWWRYRASLTRRALAQRCRPEDNWYLNRPQRWWVTAKAVLAVWLGVDLRYDASDVWADDPVCVAVLSTRVWYSQEFGRMGDSEVLQAALRGLGYRVVEEAWD